MLGGPQLLLARLELLFTPLKTPPGDQALLLDGLLAGLCNLHCLLRSLALPLSGLQLLLDGSPLQLQLGLLLLQLCLLLAQAGLQRAARGLLLRQAGRSLVQRSLPLLQGSLQEQGWLRPAGWHSGVQRLQTAMRAQQLTASLPGVLGVGPNSASTAAAGLGCSASMSVHVPEWQQARPGQ